MAETELLLKVLAENLAKKVKETHTGLVGDAELVRRWVQSRAELRDEAVAFLNKYTSAANTVSIAAGTAQYYVDNPQIDKGKALAGRWRIVSAFESPEEVKPEEQGVFQTLRLGFLQEIPADPADWDEARLIVDRAQTQVGNDRGDSEHYITMAFRNVDPSQSRAIMASLSGISYTNPTIKGVPYTGTWSNLIVSGNTEEDGSVTITIVMADPDFQLTSFDHLGTNKEDEVIYLWGVPKTQAQGIITAWKTADGADPDDGRSGSAATCSYSSDQSLVGLILRRRIREDISSSLLNVATMWNCKFKESTSYYWGITAATLAALYKTAPPNGTTYRFSVRFDTTEDLYDAQVVSTVRSAQTRTSEVTGISDSQTTNTVQRLGMTSEPSALLQATGHVKRRSVRINDDCSIDVVDTDAVPTDQTADSFEDSAAKSSTATLCTEADEELSQPLDALEEGGVPVEGEVYKADGVILRRSSTPTEAGNYRTVAEAITVIDQTADSYEQSAAKAVTSGLHTEADAALGAPVQAAGSIKRNSSTPTESGKYRTVEEVAEVTNQTADSYEESASRAASSELNTEADAALGSPTQVQGYIKRNSSTPTEAGRFRTVEESILVVDQISTGTEASAARAGTTSLHTEAEANLGAASHAAGYIKRNSSTPTESGNYRTVEESVLMNDQTSTSYLKSAAKITTMVLNTEADSDRQEVIAAAISDYDQEATAGKIKEWSLRPTESGLQRIEALEVLARNQTNGSGVETARIKIDTTDDTEHADKLEYEGFAAGTVRSYGNVETPFGRYQRKLQVRTAKPQNLEAYTSATTELYTETTDKAKNADFIPEAPGGDVDTFVTGDKNEFDKFDYTRVIRTATKAFEGVVSWDVVGKYYQEQSSAYDATKEEWRITGVSQFRERYHHYRLLLDTPAAAAAFIDNGYIGSGWSKFGTRAWMGHKVVRDDIFIVWWSYPT